MAALRAELRKRGVPARTATRELRQLAASPLLPLVQEYKQQAKQLALLAALRRALLAQSDAAPTPPAARPAVHIERREQLSAEAFWARHYCGNFPVILTGLMRDWPALTKWSPAAFRERFADVEIQVTQGREADPHPDRNFAAHCRTLRMAEFCDMVLAAGETNDFYCIANNHNMLRAPLQSLLHDVTLPAEWFDAQRLLGAVSLWIGPAGTLTPLHHDTTNILFCQVHGRKRVRLISPLETTLFATAEGFYNTLDPSALPVADIVLSPGEALFIPVGWWHEVLALDKSISISFLNFRRPNNFDWYRPGFP